MFFIFASYSLTISKPMGLIHGGGKIGWRQRRWMQAKNHDLKIYTEMMT